MWSMVAQRLTQITPPSAKPDQLWQRVEAAWSAVPQEHIQKTGSPLQKKPTGRPRSAHAPQIIDVVRVSLSFRAHGIPFVSKQLRLKSSGKAIAEFFRFEIPSIQAADSATTEAKLLHVIRMLSTNDI
ncbi:hypothetical protein TNCV_3093671 [Trichonephila clavipes]|nr:hypothetical protein TNCV_3093671 [Trichonephila clavipes]